MAQVNIDNKRGHKIDIAITEGGKLVSKSLLPHGRFGPVDEANVGQWTKNLAKRGHLKIRPV